MADIFRIPCLMAEERDKGLRGLLAQTARFPYLSPALPFHTNILTTIAMPRTRRQTQLEVAKVRERLDFSRTI